ncbi:hypothetical protein B0I26_102417 [Anoxybacillus vitaminiphilus]|uniref:Membrane protein DUF2157 n=1 Tax=Paranoxybacillus vitaminiphilus TaxID=581036 RepID=A0A327YPF3_9BACL|nr:hypothetical protein [Anoxybacillus vitaminiphilus]RAK22422.1 hypothetical protein B0I26_102417 [Anoxybacillus vitaminiphilus]
MNEKRREIIVKEIQYWKRSRLLPEQYCDYLLALYTEGAAYQDEHRSSSKNNRSHLFRLSVISMLCLLMPMTILVIYFTELSFVLQTVIFLIFLTVCFCGMFLFARERKLIHIPLVSGALILFLASVQLSDFYFYNEKEIAGIVIFCNCLLWMFIGIRLKFLYFTVSGIVGVILLLLSFFL